MTIETGDWVAYSLIEGTAHKLLRGTERECGTYVSNNPRGPNGGSTHIAYRPLKRVKARRGGRK